MPLIIESNAKPCLDFFEAMIKTREAHEHADGDDYVIGIELPDGVVIVTDSAVEALRKMFSDALPVEPVQETALLGAQLSDLEIAEIEEEERQYAAEANDDGTVLGIWDKQ